MEDTVIAVGDSTRLEIVFTTKTYTSHVTKRPRIETNCDTTHVIITTEVTATPDSLRPLVIVPYKIDLSSPTGQPRWRAEFSLVNFGDQVVRPSLVTGEPEWFWVTLPDSIAPGDTAAGLVSLTPLAIEAGFHKSFTFELDDTQPTRYTVPVQRTVLEPAAGDRVSASARDE